MTTQLQEVDFKSITLQILEELFLPKDLEGINVRLWDGSIWPSSGSASTTLVLNYPGALRAMLLPSSELGMAESYLYNDVDIVGNVEAIFDLVENLAIVNNSLKKKLILLDLLKKLPSTQSRGIIQRPRAKLRGKRHSIERDRQAVRYHYDVSNDFYALWLDPNMVYSCGYFQNKFDTIEKAQVEKLNYICTKLRLRPGQRLLDIGCGWGGLVMCAAQNYGVDATGITLSQPQADYANQRIAALGLSDKCRVLVQDYREHPEGEPYDALVSVGMFEHVGAQLLNQYFEKAYRLTKPHGVFLNHGIASTLTVKNVLRDSFSDAYVFPDGELVPIQQTINFGEAVGFEARDVESLREHYILTLRRWVERLETHHEDALHHVDEHTYRVWRLYMAGSIQGFKTRRLNVYQSLFVKPGNNGSANLPLSRSDWCRN